MFTWYERYDVGHPAIDADHRYLFELINAFHSAVVAGDSDDEHLDATLEALVAYARSHFRREETEMQACNYPALQEHKDQHEQMTQELAQFDDRFRARDPLVGIELSQFLADWLIHHMMNADTRLSAYLRALPANG